MSNMTPETNKWVLDYSIAASGEKTFTLPSQNKFLDKNIEINITTPAGVLSTNVDPSATSNVGILGTKTTTQPSSGHYITVSGDGTTTVSTAGFVASNATSTGTGTAYYPLQAATFTASGASIVASADGYITSGTTAGTISNGTKTVSGGGLTAGAGSASASSDGYYNGSTYDTSDAVVLSTTEASGYYKITASGSGEVDRAAITSQVTSAGYFAADLSPVTESAATSLSSNTATAAYYIVKSTITEGTVDPDTGEQTITITAGYYPTNREITVGGTAIASISTDIANTGISTYFDNGTSGSNSISITPRYTNTAGYLTAHTNEAGTTEYYSIKTTSVTQGTTTVSSDTATRGIASWGTGWISSGSISAAELRNTATSGVNYVDISSTSDAPVLVSGSYLFIDAGYIDNLKISLAKLVPDGASANLAAGYILSGYSAYNNDGTLIAGSIPTYDGSYTIS